MPWNTVDKNEKVLFISYVPLCRNARPKKKKYKDKQTR